MTMTEAREREVHHNSLDQATETLLVENPLLVTKLLCLEGLKPLTRSNTSGDMTGLNQTQRQIKTAWLELQAYVSSVEKTLVDALEDHPAQDELAQAALQWRTVTPPTGADFNAEERQLLNDLSEESRFVALALEYVPKDLDQPQREPFWEDGIEPSWFCFTD